MTPYHFVLEILSETSEILAFKVSGQVKISRGAWLPMKESHEAEESGQQLEANQISIGKR